MPAARHVSDRKPATPDPHGLTRCADVPFFKGGVIVTDQDKAILEGILSRCQPLRVILHGEKRSIASGELKSASICVVVPDCDKAALLSALYLAADLDIPLNINLYTREEWDELTADPLSYASWIARKGTVLYEP